LIKTANQPTVNPPPPAAGAGRKRAFSSSPGWRAHSPPHGCSSSAAFEAATRLRGWGAGNLPRSIGFVGDSDSHGLETAQQLAGPPLAGVVVEAGQQACIQKADRAGGGASHSGRQSSRRVFGNRDRHWARGDFSSSSQRLGRGHAKLTGQALTDLATQALGGKSGSFGIWPATPPLPHGDLGSWALPGRFCTEAV